jgi:hypothetical protein
MAAYIYISLLVIGFFCANILSCVFGVYRGMDYSNKEKKDLTVLVKELKKINEDLRAENKRISTENRR